VKQALGELHVRAKKLDVARAELAFALQLDPKNAFVARSYCEALWAANDDANASKIVAQLAKTLPKHPMPLFLQAVSLERAGKDGDAIDAYEKALAIDPKNAAVKYNLGINRLTAGQLRRDIWLKYEFRWVVLRESPQRGFPQPYWRGEPLAGKSILIYAEQGLGDTLQFVRFAAPLKRVAHETVFWVQPQLLALVAGVRGVDRVMPLHDGRPEVEYDVDLEIMELPHALRVSVESLADEVPYVAREALASRPRGRRRRPHVGIAWAGGGWDARRSLPREALERLVDADSQQFFSLQYGAGQLPEGVVDLACGPIEELARRMARLDLVIGVDSMVAHLAGAMGLGTWTLLPASCDWRWMADREDSPWYPGMRLYRQQAAGRWGDVVDRVRADLREFTRRAVTS